MERDTASVEQVLTLRRSEGLMALDLFRYLERAYKEIGSEALKRMPVSLCLDEIETHTTRIVQVNNEGDNSTLWLKLDAESSKLAAKGFHRE